MVVGCTSSRIRTLHLRRLRRPGEPRHRLQRPHRAALAALPRPLRLQRGPRGADAHHARAHGGGGSRGGVTGVERGCEWGQGWECGGVGFEPRGLCQVDLA